MTTTSTLLMPSAIVTLANSQSMHAKVNSLAAMLPILASAHGKVHPSTCPPSINPSPVHEISRRSMALVFPALWAIAPVGRAEDDIASEIYKASTPSVVAIFAEGNPQEESLFICSGVVSRLGVFSYWVWPHFTQSSTANYRQGSPQTEHLNMNMHFTCRCGTHLAT
jgi:hypothetical protein